MLVGVGVLLFFSVLCLVMVWVCGCCICEYICCFIWLCVVVMWLGDVGCVVVFVGVGVVVDVGVVVLVGLVVMVIFIVLLVWVVVGVWLVRFFI